VIAVLKAAALVRPCSPLPPSPPDEIARCVEISEGETRLTAEALRRLRFREGPAVVAAGKDLYWADRTGRAVPAMPFDNGADYFVEGLARTIRSGKVGFVDRRLREMVPARWDWAFPFEGGVAAVCEGCHPAGSGERRTIEGGKWGYVDRAGRVVVPVEYPRERLPPPEEARRSAGHRPQLRER
jgi:hypothetical protein